jgi:hypothetical protein
MCTSRLESVAAASRRRLPNSTFQCTPIDHARVWPDTAGLAATAVVVVLSSSPTTKRLAQVLPSWDRFLLGPRVALVAHVSPEQDRSMVSSVLGLQRAPRCRLALPSDHACSCTANGNPTIMVRRRVALPAGLSGQEGRLDVRPKSFCSAHGMEYVVSTKAYTLPMLTLEALQHFDFFAKVDVDTFMLRPVDVAATMMSEGAHWLHTFDVTSAYSSRCSVTLQEHLTPYLIGAGCTARQTPSAHALAAVRGAWPTFYSNFVAGWLGLFQAPQMLQYAQYWWSWPGGWRYRWSDQEFWGAALSVAEAWRRVVNLSGWRGQRFVHCDGRATLHGLIPQCMLLLAQT